MTITTGYTKNLTDPTSDREGFGDEVIDFYGTCSDAFAGCAGQIDSFTSQHRGKTGAAYVVALALLLQDKYQAAFDYVTTNDGWGIADLEWYFGYQNGISLDNASRLIGDVSVDFAGSGGDPRDEDGLADLAIAIGPYKSLQAIRHHLVPDAIGRREAGNLGYNYRQAPCCQVPTAADHLRISNRLNPVVADLKAGRISMTWNGLIDVCVCVAAEELGLTTLEANRLRSALQSFWYGEMQMLPEALVLAPPGDGDRD